METATWARQTVLLLTVGACLLAFHVGVWVEALNNPNYGLMESPPICHCSSFASCQRKSYHPADPLDKQVMMVSDGRRSWHSWHWDLLSTVISSKVPDNKDLMCYTHMKGKQYGFIVKVTNFTGMTDGSDLVWIANNVRQARNFFADYLAIDFLSVLSESGLNTTLLTQFIRKLSYSIHQDSFGTKLMCLLPWAPEQLRGDDETHAAVLDALSLYCDKFISGSQSYLTPTESCRARATIPFTKLVLGVDEYMAQGVPVEKFFLGVPWHGFVYTCDTFEQKTNTCHLQPPASNGTKLACDYDKARVRMSLGDMRNKWSKQVERISGHQWERFTMSAFFTYQNETSMKYQQVRFEDMHSLTLKYHLSRELEMGGVIIWSGDDLDYDPGSLLTTSYDKFMWEMLKETMFKPVRNSYFLDQFNAFPAKMAGVGVGCMLLGTVLGFVIGAVVCVRRQRKTLQPPFMKDHPQEYQDEDPNM